MIVGVEDIRLNKYKISIDCCYASEWASCIFNIGWYFEIINTLVDNKFFHI